MTLTAFPHGLTVTQRDGDETIEVTLLTGHRACPTCRRATSLFVLRDLIGRCSECDQTYKEARDAKRVRA